MYTHIYHTGKEEVEGRNEKDQHRHEKDKHSKDRSKGIKYSHLGVSCLQFVTEKFMTYQCSAVTSGSRRVSGANEGCLERLVVIGRTIQNHVKCLQADIFTKFSRLEGESD